VAELASLKAEEIIRAEGITTMKYTIILTEKPSGGIRVSVPALPECTVEADNRDDAIHLAREAIAQLVSRSEIVHVDISQQPKPAATGDDVPWEWFGAAKDDATWDALFEDIEQRREATRKSR
jgi:predicted RNase H-like HicB family nuclease